MVEPIQRTEGLPASQGNAAGIWPESVKRAGSTAPLAGREPRDGPRPAGKSTNDGIRNLTLRFRIDPETHDVTVLIVDPSTRRVVRSVPPEELAKLIEGELVELRI